MQASAEQLTRAQMVLAIDGTPVGGQAAERAGQRRARQTRFWSSGARAHPRERRTGKKHHRARICIRLLTMMRIDLPPRAISSENSLIPLD